MIHPYRTFFALLLIAVVASLLWCVTSEKSINDQQYKQIQDLKLRLTDKTSRERFEFQEKCSLQAEKTFKSLGYKMDEAALQSHYNQKMARCFMTVISNSFSSGKMFINKFLMDAYEQRDFAKFAWMSSENKTFFEVPPIMCELMPLSKSEVTCKSADEYDQFVTEYLE